MQETAKVNYVHYGKASKKAKGKVRPSGGSGSRVNAGNPMKPHGNSRKVPLPNDICWRCGKSRHQKGQPCKAVEAICRNCGTKGHYEKVCMKKSTHLVNITGTSTTSTGSADYQHVLADMKFPVFSLCFPCVAEIFPVFFIEELTVIVIKEMSLAPSYTIYFLLKPYTA